MRNFKRPNNSKFCKFRQIMWCVHRGNKFIENRKGHQKHVLSHPCDEKYCPLVVTKKHKV